MNSATCSYQYSPAVSASNDGDRAFCFTQWYSRDWGTTSNPMSSRHPLSRVRATADQWCDSMAKGQRHPSACPFVTQANLFCLRSNLSLSLQINHFQVIPYAAIQAVISSQLLSHLKLIHGNIHLGARLMEREIEPDHILHFLYHKPRLPWRHSRNLAIDQRLLVLGPESCSTGDSASSTRSFISWT